ncbi:MAG: UvrB/UvrC motif-containing protein [Oscillospiraceae bacterium]|nr:UvrB/UvrC motif-containing protein [Oscillospiraceae bacterium]MDD4546407.1 UvrB/UvrC motif-containing protein [Oscillospiraceae bacterium]
MLCQNCEKNTATTFIKKTINGNTKEWHLCAECASKQGFDSMINGFGFDLGDFWGSLFAEPSTRSIADTVRCEGCGHSFREIAESGKAGCPSCYRAYYDRLLPSIQRIHGKTGHTGKVPSGAGEKLKKEKEIDHLQKELSECIADQQYEKCAQLRDRIRELEEEEKN